MRASEARKWVKGVSRKFYFTKWYQNGTARLKVFGHRRFVEKVKRWNIVSERGIQLTQFIDGSDIFFRELEVENILETRMQMKQAAAAWNYHLPVKRGNVEPLFAAYSLRL